MSIHPRHAGHHGSGTEADMSMPTGSSSSSTGNDGAATTSTMSSSMAMVFTSGTGTPLYSDAWTPRSAGAYAGTCLFLIALAITARLLVAGRSRLEQRWQDRDAGRRYVAAPGKAPLAERLGRDLDAKQMTMTLSENGAEEKVFVVAGERHRAARPWRFSVDPVRAAVDTVIVGVAYLLMLAVMTMNVGYFLSVLAGVFVGSLAVGRHAGLPTH